jgi:hypothetical protein
LAEPTSSASLQAQYRDTGGAIHDWIGWRLHEPIGATAPGVLSISSLHVQGAEGNLAWVDLGATIHYPFGDQHVSGPAILQRIGAGWKVLDYSWEGMSQREAVFAGAHGSSQTGGITVTVIGAVLERTSLDVFATITNTTGEELDLQQSDGILTRDGRELTGLTPYADAPVAPHGKLALDFLLDGQSLPPTTTGFRLELQVATNPGYKTISLDVPVTLHR